MVYLETQDAALESKVIELVKKQMDSENNFASTLDYYDVIFARSGTPTEMWVICRDFEVSLSWMYDFLVSNGVMKEYNGVYIINTDCKDYRGLTKTRYDYIDGRLGVKTEWTEKGQIFLYHLLQLNGLSPVIETWKDYLEQAGVI